jgi:hypothetical protein
MTTPPFTFNHPANIIVAGPTGCGKTQFVSDAIANLHFRPIPNRIVWVYAEMQQAYQKLMELSQAGQLPEIEFVKAPVDYEELYQSFSSSDVNLLVVDDQMNESKRQEASFTNLFTKGSHHRNITILFLTQNIYEKGFRTANLNAQYIVAFRNRRDATQIEALARQMHPRKSCFLVDAFADATNRPHGYVVLDYTQSGLPELQVMTNVLSDEPIAYQPI